MKTILRRLKHWIFRHVHCWRGSELESEDGALIYYIRDCRICSDRQVQNRLTGKWSDPRETRFSSVPYFEDWHREQFQHARPRAAKSKTP